jgi:anaerobic ribonucleoside-triphosphate reductase activating protein
MSDETRDPQGGKPALIDDVYHSIAAATGIEGITLSGGEPFLQIDALHELLRRIRRNTNLGVIMYTGYYLRELKEMHDEKVDEIVSSLVDILIDGPYIDELNDGKSLRGSQNQTVHFLTKRYLDMAALYDRKTRNTELRVSGSDLFFIGIPDRDTLQSWKKIAGKVP